MMVNLVENFIAKRRREYVEPQFLGNPKRTRRAYGYSKKRYAACLYSALTSLRGEDIGRRIGTSASQIRKWHADEGFSGKMRGELKEFMDYADREVKSVIQSGKPFNFGDVGIWSSCAASRIMRAIYQNSRNPPGVYPTVRAALKDIERDVPGERTKFPKKSEETIKAMDQLAGYETNPQVELRQILGFVNDRLHKWIVGVLSDTHSRKSDRATAERLIRELLTEPEQTKTRRFNNARRRATKQQSATVE